SSRISTPSLNPILGGLPRRRVCDPAEKRLVRTRHQVNSMLDLLIAELLSMLTGAGQRMHAPVSELRRAGQRIAPRRSANCAAPVSVLRLAGQHMQAPVSVFPP